MAKNPFSRKPQDETGFGTKSFSDLDRLILKNGDFNVTRKGAFWEQFSLYHWLITMHWGWLFFYGILTYFLVNFLFALGYFALGPASLTAAESLSHWEFFIHCFYFSTQTLTTLGYGFISPIQGGSSFLAAFEAMVGLLAFAFVTGILYGRFSKAKSKILFSKNMVVSPYRGISGLKFRIANPMKNQLIEMKATVIYSFLENEEGVQRRRYLNLNLEIDHITMFPLPWTIVHPLDDESPLKDKPKSQLEAEQTEFIVLLHGYDDTFNQYIHQINSYRAQEVMFNSDFKPMFDAAFEKSTTVHLDKISSIKDLTS